MSRLLPLIFVLLLSFQIKGQPVLAGKPFPAKSKALDSIIAVSYKNNTATRQEVYQIYIQEAIDADDEELEMLIQLHSLFHAYEKKEISDTHFITELHTLIAKCDKSKWNHLAAIGCKLESTYWKRKGVMAKELKYALEAYEYYKDLDHNFYTDKKHDLRWLAEGYMRFDDYKNALKYLHFAEGVPSKFDAAVLNDIAIIHMNSGLDDSALYYFDLLYQGSVKDNNRVYALLAQSNKVGIHMKNEQYDTALTLVKSYLPLAEKRGRSTHVAADYDRMGYLHLMLGDIKEADKCNNIALEMFRAESPNWYYENLNYGYNVFNHAAMIKAALKQYDLAYRYSDSTRIMADSLHKKFDIVKLKNIENEIAQSKLATAEQMLELEQRNTVLQRNLLITIVAVGGLLLAFIIGYYRKRKELLEKEKNSAKYELKASKDKLATFTTTIQEKNKLLEGLERKLTSYESDERTAEYAETISEMQGSTILTDDDWADFKKNFDKAHPGYLSRIREKYPTLSQAERRYIVLAKIDMSTKEMASVLGVTAGSVRTTKSRMMKKIGFENEEELRNMIQNL
ncbi:MAG: hypothetical protein H6551_07505 [Chitinophagales bacterium]|nr:hypothetical protein [Chitinophagaceae bacterium]MCB9064975.1 hypothetical protein [Chitinophagales bacterium]